VLLSAQAGDGATPAHLAASFGHVGIMSLLGDLDPGRCEVNYRTDSRRNRLLRSSSVFGRRDRCMTAGREHGGKSIVRELVRKVRRGQPLHAWRSDARLTAAWLAACST
jgi:hypothetical protein